MLQVDENIGGRQDQKYNGLRTKMSAVGSLMMAGCFVVGYFSAATTTTNTTTTAMAQTPVLRDASSADPSPTRTGPKLDLLQSYPYVTITNKTPFNVQPVKEDDTDQYYDRMYNFSVGYVGTFWGFCHYDFMRDGLYSGRTITASSRGLCLVDKIYATLKYPVSAPPTKAFSASRVQPDDDGWLTMKCTPYTSSGTSHSIYSILMKDDDGGCCVLSKHQIQKCP